MPNALTPYRIEFRPSPRAARVQWTRFYSDDATAARDAERLVLDVAPRAGAVFTTVDLGFYPQQPAGGAR